MKTTKNIIALCSAIIAITVIAQSCSSSREIIANKSGAQLWGENCIRCHNGPSPVDFSDEQWKTIGLHMQVRANLTNEETDKIVEFLRSAN